MSGLDYERWVAEALLSIVPKALTLVADDGLPDGHALYVSFDTRHPEVRLDASLAENHPELMTIVFEHQFWDLVVDEQGFSVVLAFGGERRLLFVPWESVRGFADPAAEFAFDTTGRLSGGVRRLVAGDADPDNASTDDPESVADQREQAQRFARSQPAGSRPQPEEGSPAGEVVPFARPVKGDGGREEAVTEGEEE